MSNIPTISLPPPHTAQREPYAQRRASRERQLGRGHRHAHDHDQLQQDAPLGYTQNPYLSHLRRGYEESEVSSSSFGGTSVLSGSLLSSNITSATGNSNLGAQHAGRRPRSSFSGTSRQGLDSKSTGLPILAPIPQRISSSSTTFPFNPPTPSQSHSQSQSPYLQPLSSSLPQTPNTQPTAQAQPKKPNSHPHSHRRRPRHRIETTINTPLRRIVRYASMDLGCPAWVIVIMGVALVALLKWVVGVGGVSSLGDGNGSMELHRIWMKMISSEPLGVRWYTPLSSSTPSSDPSNPGGKERQLVHPPLRAYFIWLSGKIGGYLFPSSFSPSFSSSSLASGTPAGDVSSAAAAAAAMKRYMRGTVLGLEAVSWWPIVGVWGWKGWGVGSRSKRTRIVTILSILLHPTLILIDNASFDYTFFSLGMTLLAVYLFQRGNDVAGTGAFVVGVLFDQMGVWWVAAVGGYVVGKCVWLGGDQGRILAMKTGGTAVITSFLAILPFLRPFPSAPLVVLGRLFSSSSEHGMFENKVASFWGAGHVVFGWEWRSGSGIMRVLAGLATLLGIAPTAGILLWVSYRLRLPPNTPPRTSSLLPPTAPLLPLALFTSSMACYLLSPHAQGKNIVFPMLSVLMLLGEKGEGDGTVWDGIVGLLNVATFSLYPLLKQDGLVVQYIVCTIGWNCLVGYNPVKVVDSKMRWFGYVVYSCIALSHVMEALFSAPNRYSDIYDDINALISFSVFSLAWLVASWKLLEMAVGMVGLGEIGSDRPVSRGNKKDE